MKLLFDTSVWVEHLRRGALLPVMPLLRGRYTLAIDSVVVAELLAGCRSKRERNFVEKVCAPFERAGRVLHPSAADHRRAALALSRLRQAGTSLKNPGAALLDGMIAALAAREGAMLITLNESDFAALARELPLTWQSFNDFRAAI